MPQKGSRPPPGLPRIRQVLKPGGILTVSTCSQEQLRHGYWHYNLIPEAADAPETATSPSTSCSKSSTIAVSHTGELRAHRRHGPGRVLLDPHGPLSKEWATETRSGRWSPEIADRASPGSVSWTSEERGSRVRNDALRSHIGQATIVCVPKIARQGFELSGVCARLTSSLQSFEHITGVGERQSDGYKESTIGEIVCRARTRALFRNVGQEDIKLELLGGALTTLTR